MMLECDIFTYRIKCISAILLYAWSGLMGVIAFSTFTVHGTSIATFKLSGGETVPEMNLDYSMFSQDMQLASLTLFFLAIFGVITSFFKKPYLSWIYVVAALCIATGCESAKEQALHFEEVTVEQYDSICFNTNNRIQILQRDLEMLVNLWLCAGDCKCNDGARGTWNSYGEPKLNSFKRTMSSKKGKNAAGDVTLPMEFSNRPGNVNTFK